MSVNLYRILQDLDGEFTGKSGSVDTTVSIDVVPGDTIQLRLETDGPGAKSRAITTELTQSDIQTLISRMNDSL